MSQNWPPDGILRLMQIKCLFLLLLPLALFCAEELSFQTLIDMEEISPKFVSEWNGKEVSLRGYVYDDAGKWVVSCDPNLPSCCRRSGPFRRVFLHGDLAEADKHQMATVQGTFEIREGSDHPLHLHNARFHSVEPDKTLYLILIIAIAAVMAIVLRRRRNA